MLKQSSPSRCIGTMRPCRSAAELRAARPFPPSLVASPELNPPSQAQQNRPAQRCPAPPSKSAHHNHSQAQRWPARPSKTAERSKTAKRSDVAQRSDGPAQRSKVAKRSKVAQRSDSPPSAAMAKAPIAPEAVTVFWAPFPSTGKGLGIGAAPSPRGDGGEAYSAQGKWVPKGENRPRFSSFSHDRR